MAGSGPPSGAGQAACGSDARASAPSDSPDRSACRRRGISPGQAWYQGGIDILDWTDPDNPVEIAYHDRGPRDGEQRSSAGSWSVYWYNGYIYSSEIARGLDVFELVPSPYISQNEIDAAKTVRFDFFNAQEQPRFVWPPSFALARAYLDQLERSGGLATDRIVSSRAALTAAERASGAQRSAGLTRLAADLDGVAGRAPDEAKVRTLASALRALAAAQ